jgi:hypothetical protein
MATPTDRRGEDVDLESLKRHLDEDERDLDPANPYEAHILRWVAAARTVLDEHQAIRAATSAHEVGWVCDGCGLDGKGGWLRQWPCPTVEAIASVYGEET